MLSLTTSDITRAAVNATRSEIAAMTFTREFADTRWSELDFYGWRDPRTPHRGYLVTEHDGALVTVVLTTRANRGSTGRKAMCTVCRAVDDGANVALFVARRRGPAGRRGDTVGTYVCAGLDCSAQLRHPSNRAGRTRLADGLGSDDERAAAMLDRLATFVTAVTG